MSFILIPVMSKAGSLTRNIGRIGIGQVLFTLVVVFSAFLFGIIAVTANPVLIAISFAMLLGTVFLAKPAWSVWIILFFGLLVAGVLPLYLEGLASKAIWGLSMLGIMLLFSALFSVATTPSLARETPGFIWLALAFIVFAAAATLVKWYSFGEIFTGFKRYFQVWGLMFAMAWLTFSRAQVLKWRSFVFLIACLQLPFAVFELVHVVPMRAALALAIPGLVPIDAVAGTFGVSRTGGGANAAMAVFLVAMLAFILARFNEKLITPGRTLLLSLLVMMPLFMGETKAVIVWLPLLFSVLYRKEMIRRPQLALAGLIFGGLLTMAVIYAYLNVTGDRNLETMVHNLLGYNYYGKYSNNIYLNRTTVLTFWASNQGWHDPVGFLFGNGLGSAHGGSGHLDARFLHYGIGLTGVSSLLWELGLLGTALFYLILIAAWRCCNVLQQVSREAQVRADASAIQVGIALLSVFALFRNDMLEMMTIQIAFVSMFGYLAWLHRQQVLTVPKGRV